MTEEVIEQLLPRLERALGIQEHSEQVQMCLQDALLDAEAELCLYLQRSMLEESMMGKVLELAKVFYQSSVSSTGTTPGVKAMSYSEGDVSQSITPMSTQDFEAAKESILRSVAHFRRRARSERLCRHHEWD